MFLLLELNRRWQIRDLDMLAQEFVHKIEVATMESGNEMAIIYGVE